MKQVWISPWMILTVYHAKYLFCVKLHLQNKTFTWKMYTARAALCLF
ncbi:Uncharacterised protein [Mycobacteroides abscessus subsp. abscessus]|nr:Uncharacterised protein [Mycobacteroides abscessus subsp. abscessus]